jgi:hypothetical protein
VVVVVVIGVPISCDDDARRRATADPASGVNGIDYVEVDPDDQRRLSVGFLKPLSGPALTTDKETIEGAERNRDIEVVDVAPGTDNVLVVVDQPGDFSPYLLRLVDSALDAEPPAGYDPALASMEFSFKAGCPSDLDCGRPLGVDEVRLSEPRLDYLAKDYEGFRQLLLDRVANLVPDWRERNPADPLVTVVEVLADAADRLSYRQDAHAAEAYLGTARRRVSVRRHARLLDYAMHDGCTARTWVQLSVEAGSAAEVQGLPVETPVLAVPGGGSPVFNPTDLDHEAGQTGLVFTTLTTAQLRAARNRIAIHTWSGQRCWLPLGATAATLVNEPDLELTPGELLLLAEVASPATGRAADADPTHRQVVRLTSVKVRTDEVVRLPNGNPTPVVEVTWDEADALTFTLVVRTMVPGSGTDDPVECGLARGNLVLAHHARRMPPIREGRKRLGPVPSRGRWRPLLTDDPVACAEPATPSGPAAGALQQDARAALPLIELSDGEDEWAPRRDLLASDRFDRGFVMELERDSSARLRFGDDTHGRGPSAGTEFTASWWRGGGRAGNNGRDTLSRIGTTLAGIQSVTNPLPAAGGQDPEPVEQVRQQAPAAFFRQERAVTTDDWVEVARRLDGVQEAMALVRWTGSWWTVFLTLDLVGGRRLADEPLLEASLTERLDRYRVAGFDLELIDPVDVSVYLNLRVCVAADTFRADVASDLLDALSNRDVPGMGRGLFHPDNFSFGRPLWVSDVVARAMTVPGVVDVVVTALNRWGEQAADELTLQRLPVYDLEIIRLDNDPSLPENGVLHLDLVGGR